MRLDELEARADEIVTRGTPSDAPLVDANGRPVTITLRPTVVGESGRVIDIVEVAVETEKD